MKVESGNLIVKKRRVVFVFDDENGFDFLFLEMMEVEVKYFFINLWFYFEIYGKGYGIIK